MAQHMPEESGPLLLSTRAALRLSLLLQHGVENTPSMAAVLARAGLPPAAAAVAAALLDQPVPLGSVYEDSSPPWLAARDVLAEVAVSTSLLRALQVPAGSLVAVRNAGRPEVLPHLARVVPAPDSSSRHALPTAYLAPSLAHNLGLPLHLDALLRQPGPGGTSNPHDAPRPGRVLLQRYAAPAGVAVAMLPQPMSDGAAVPLAAEVHVAVVRRPSTVLLQSPHSTATSNNAGSPADGNRGNAGSHAGDSAQLGGMCAAGSSEEAGADVVAALQSWFMGHTRVVCKGDVLAVPKQVGLGSLAAHLVPNLHSGSQPGRHEQELVYFKIAKLVLGSSQEGHTATSCAGTQPSAVAGPAAVDVSVTAVQLVGTCASSIPVGLDSYLAAAHSSRIPPKEEQQAEEGGQPVWHQLAQLLAAAMHPAGSRLPLRLAVLLHGPSGSGKRTAAAAAAAAAGYHAVSLSCHDIKAPPAAAQWHTLEGLNAAFAAAAEYRPAVLLLHNLQVLVEDAHGASDVIIARTGAALAECIRQGCKRLPAVSSHQGINGDGDNKGRTEAGARSATQELFPAPVVLIACTEAVDDIPAPLRRCFTHEFAVDGPPQRQRQHLLSANLSGAPLASPEATGLPGGLPWLEETAFHTAGLLPRELRTVAAEAAVAAVAAVLPTRDILQEALLQAAPAAEGIGGEGGGGNQRQQAVQVPAAPRLTQQHLAAAVDAVRARTATDIGAPKISDVRWEDVGGLEEVKRSILDTVELPLKHPQLFAGGLRRRSGVLFYGPPGTGKTLLAKAVATECSINFLSVKGPELINMYVGESERQIREVFAKARLARPCVVFFDELDSLAPARGKGSDSGGVMDRVVSQLLAEIDGVQGGAGSNDVFIIGATNRPDLLDPALLRPGRLDKLLFVGIASDAGSRFKVLQALTRKFQLAADVELAEVAERCHGRFTGADMYALCSDAWMGAFKRRISEQGDEEQNTSEKQQEEAGDANQAQPSSAQQGIVVRQADFLGAALALTPSLTAEEVEKYEEIRRQYEAR